MRDAGKGAERICDGGVVDPRGAGCGSRCRSVLAIVGARNARLGGKRIVEAGTRLDERVPGTGPYPRGNDGGVVLGLPLEDAKLDLGVRLEGAVAVEMIGLEVQQGRRSAGGASRRPRAGRTRARTRSSSRARRSRRAPSAAVRRSPPLRPAARRHGRWRRGARRSSSSRSSPSRRESGSGAAVRRARSRSTPESRARARLRRAASPRGRPGS